MLAMGGSILLALIAMIDPIFTWDDYVSVCSGIWGMAAGHFAAQILFDKKKPHEKTDSCPTCS